MITPFPMLRKASAASFVVASLIVISAACSSGLSHSEHERPKARGALSANAIENTLAGSAVALDKASSPGSADTCEIANALVARAKELRQEGRLFRAERAIDDAARRCSHLGDALELERAALRKDSAIDPSATMESLATAADALSKKGDAAGARRMRELGVQGREARSHTRVGLNTPHSTDVYTLAWSNDSKLAAVGHAREIIVEDGNFLSSKEHYVVDLDITALWFSSDANSIMALSKATGDLQWIDRVAQRETAALPGNGAEIDTWIVSPDGRYVGLQGGSSVRLVDLASHKQVGIMSLTSPIGDFAFSPSGNNIVTTSEDNVARLWATPDMRESRELMRGTSLSHVHFKSENELVIVDGSSVSSIDARDGKTLAPKIDGVDNMCTPWFIGPKSHLVWTCYAYLEDTRGDGPVGLGLNLPTTTAHLYSSFDGLAASPDGTRIWFSLFGQQGVGNRRTGRRDSLPPVPRNMMGSVSFRPDNKWIVGQGFGGTSLWAADGKHKDLTMGVDKSCAPASAISFDANGKLSVVRATPILSDDESTVTDIALSKGELGASLAPRSSLPNPRDQPMMAADAGVAGLLYDDRLDIVELAKGTVRSTIKLDPSQYQTAYLAASGARALIAAKNELRVVDATGAVLRAWPRGSTDRFAISPSGSRFAAIGQQQTVLYDVAKQEVKELAPSGVAPAFMSDDLLLQVDDQGHLSVADLHLADRHSGRLLDSDLRKDLFASVEKPRDLRGVTFLADGTLAFIDAKGPTIVDLARHRSIALQSFPADVSSARISPNGKVIAVSSSNVPEITLFDTQSGERLGIIQLVGASSAYFQGAGGHIEAFGIGAQNLSCIFAPHDEPMTTCEDRYFEPGLLARTLAGRGQTLEDVSLPSK